MNTSPCGTAAELRAAQAVFDNASPDEAFDDYVSENDAKSLAADLIRGTPAAWSQWLDATCNDDRTPLYAIELARVLRSGSRDLQVPELLALLMNCNDADLAQVRWQLVQHFDAANSADAEEMAADILRAQDREQREQRELALWGEDEGLTQ